jgi:hypothetical protein
MMDNPLYYFVAKFVAYCVWCYVGLRLFRSGERLMIPRAFGYGTLRLAMGLFFGILIYLLSSALITSLAPSLPGNAIAYLAVYVPVRWVEWTIMAVLILPGSIYFSEWIVGTGRKDRLWRLGGIAISCLADIPLIVSLGGVIPVGRFLC